MYLCHFKIFKIFRKMEKQLNKWYDELDWCPSQCYYYFIRNNEMYCIYLRWRHEDPWTADIIKCVDGEVKFDEDAVWMPIEIPFFKDDELENLKEYVIGHLDIIMKTLQHIPVEGYLDVVPEIKNVSFPRKGKMQVDLKDGRCVIVDVSRFPSIKELSMADRKNWYCMDNGISFDKCKEVIHIEQILGNPLHYVHETDCQALVFDNKKQ